MKTYALDAKHRTIVGRKVKSLRASGMLPGTVYGKKVKSVSVAVDHAAFAKTYQAAGVTGVVELSLDGAPRPVLIHSVQKDPVKGQVLHVEFYQVDLKEKVTTRVPLEFVGEAPAVVNKIGVLLTLVDEVEVEALPTDLPEKIAVDVSTLAEVDQEIKVSQLSVPPGVTIMSGGDQAVIRVGSLVSKEAEAQAAEEAAAAAAAVAETPVEGAPASPAGGPAKEESVEEKPSESPQGKAEADKKSG